jgi:hypothetical protein
MMEAEAITGGIERFKISNVESPSRNITRPNGMHRIVMVVVQRAIRSI